VDITDVASSRKEGTLKQVPQEVAERFFFHEEMDEFTGFQYTPDCQFAEGFVHQGLSGVI
jgi:hypothetical protein